MDDGICIAPSEPGPRRPPINRICCLSLMSPTPTSVLLAYGRGPAPLGDSSNCSKARRHAAWSCCVAGPPFVSFSLHRSVSFVSAIASYKPRLFPPILPAQHDSCPFSPKRVLGDLRRSRGVCVCGQPGLVVQQDPLPPCRSTTGGASTATRRSRSRPASKGRPQLQRSRAGDTKRHASCQKRDWGGGTREKETSG